MSVFKKLFLSSFVVLILSACGAEEQEAQTVSDSLQLASSAATVIGEWDLILDTFYCEGSSEATRAALLSTLESSNFQERIRLEPDSLIINNATDSNELIETLPFKTISNSLPEAADLCKTRLAQYSRNAVGKYSNVKLVGDTLKFPDCAGQTTLVPLVSDLKLELELKPVDEQENYEETLILKLAPFPEHICPGGVWLGKYKRKQ